MFNIQHCISVGYGSEPPTSLSVESILGSPPLRPECLRLRLALLESKIIPASTGRPE